MYVDRRKLFELEKEFKDLQENPVAMVSTNSLEYFEVFLFVLDLISNKWGAESICVTLNRSADNICTVLKNRDIDIKNVYFVDCVSKTAGIEKPIDGCDWVSHPKNLDEIDKFINANIDNLQGDNKILFFDSASTLLIYNDSNTVLQFISSSINRMRANNIKGIFMVPKKEIEPKFVDQMIRFCDKFIEM